MLLNMFIMRLCKVTKMFSKLNCYIITLAASFSVVPISADRVTLPTTLPNMIMKHFASSKSCNAYFCTVEDASMFIKSASSDSILFKTSVISSKELSEKIVLHDTQHRLGIFIDTNCPSGKKLLLHNQELFNSSYAWLLWSEDPNPSLDALLSSRLNVDTDLTIIVRLIAKPSEDPYVDDNNETSHYFSSDLVDTFAKMEVYRTHSSSPFFVNEYERWIGNSIYSIAPISERANLDGLLFSSSILLPNMNVHDISRDQLTDPAYAYNVDVRWRYGISLFITICQHYMNCSIQLLQAKCNDESSYIPCNGSLGAIDLVNSGEADFAIIPFTWDRQKIENIDYSLPIMNVRQKYLFLRPKMIDSWMALMLPLSPEIWLLLMGLMILGVITFRVVAPYDDSSQHNDGWGGSTFLVLSALAQQGIPDNAYKLTTRVIYLCILGVTFLVYVYYSTALLNGLLLPPPHTILFASELFDSHLSLGIEDSPTLRNRLTMNEDLDARLRTKLSTFASTDVFTEVTAGVDKTVREPFAILADEFTLHQRIREVSMTDAEMCSISLVNDEQASEQASFILRPNSPYKELLRRGVIRTRERGEMDRLKTIWFPDVPPCLWKTDALQFGLQPHAIAYVIIVVGMLASLLILVSEKIYYNPHLLKNPEIVNHAPTQ